MNYLTTDELVQSLNQQELQSHEHAQKIDKISNKTSKHKKFYMKKKYIFFFIVFLVILHLSYIGVKVISSINGTTTFNQAHVLAVPMDQDITNRLNAKVVVIRKIDLEDIQVGQEVAIYGKYGTVVYWIEEVVAVDIASETLTTTFDGFISNQTDYDDVHGIFIRESNLVGIIGYVSTTPRGYIIIVLFYALIIYVLYYTLLRKKKDKPNLS